MTNQTARRRSRAKKPRKSAKDAERPYARKVSITVDNTVLQAMEEEAEYSGRTLSAEITEALARELRRRRLQELIEQYEAQHGTVSPQELASIQAEWQA